MRAALDAGRPPDRRAGVGPLLSGLHRPQSFEWLVTGPDQPSMGLSRVRSHRRPLVPTTTTWAASQTFHASAGRSCSIHLPTLACSAVRPAGRPPLARRGCGPGPSHRSGERRARSQPPASGGLPERRDLSAPTFPMPRGPLCGPHRGVGVRAAAGCAWSITLAARCRPGSWRVHRAAPFRSARPDRECSNPAEPPARAFLLGDSMRQRLHVRGATLSPPRTAPVPARAVERVRAVPAAAG